MSGDTAPPAGRRPLAALVADTGPLRRSREFRLLLAGEGLTVAGSMITEVTVPYQVYELTRSSLIVGVVSLALLVPYLTVGMIGGALADAVDRRRLVLAAEAGIGACSLLLLANSAGGHPRLWALFAVTMASAVCDALQSPSLTALLPRVVDQADIPAATALQSFVTNGGQVAGPAVAGLLIASGGTTLAFGVDAASSILALAAMWRMRAVPPPPDADRPGLAGVLAGVRYARSRRDLLGTYAIDMSAMFFGMPEALFPQLAARLGGPGILGLFFAAPAAGSLLVSATSGWTGRTSRHGRILVFAAAGWGASIAVLGVARGPAVAIAALVLAGGADMVSGLMRQNIWNQSVPDRLRGRLAGIEMVSYTSGPLLGNFEGGVAEAIGGLRFSVVSGGLAAVAATALIAVAIPELWAYRSPAAHATHPGPPANVPDTPNM